MGLSTSRRAKSQGRIGEQDSRTGARAAALLSIGVNLALALGKLIVGVSVRSIGVVVDALHSAADAGTSLIVLLGLQAARQPPDDKHPFGHGRAEEIAALLLSVLLLVTAFESAKASLARIATPAASLPGSATALAVLAGTIVLKEALFHFSMRASKRSGYGSLAADAWHHRSDALSTLVVMAGLWLRSHGAPWADAATGMLVAAFIAFMGFQLLKSAIDTLLGTAPSNEEVERIVRTARSRPGVTGVHEVLVHSYGKRRWVSLHVEIPAGMSAREAHAIADDIEKTLMANGWDVVIVHPDPADAEDGKPEDPRQDTNR